MSGQEPSDPDLDNALDDGKEFSVEVYKEQHRHRETMAHGERGVVGKLVGGENHAPTNIAFFIALSAILIAVMCLVAAWCTQDGGFWADQAERAFAFAAAALTFIYGRSGK